MYSQEEIPVFTDYIKYFCKCIFKRFGKSGKYDYLVIWSIKSSRKLHFANWLSDILVNKLAFSKLA